MKIELRDLCKTFDKKSNAINHLNIEINDGEFISLLGPSGCGKSTTMLMLAGIYKPTGGSILFDNRSVGDLEPQRRNIGMVFQSYALYPHMTVLENIAFPLKQMKVPKAERLTRAKQAAAMVRLDSFLDRKPSELSGGQQQRVALARAIVKKPSLLLLDEPLSNLDARLKIEMREEIRKLQKELGITTIMVTHDQEEAMTMADRIALMKDGELVQYASPMELYNNPNSYFVAQFIGTPPMNFLQGNIRVNGDTIDFGMQNKTIPFKNTHVLFERENQGVYLGIRPHDLKVGADGDLSFQGIVRFVEPLGHSILVSVEIENAMVRVLTNPHFTASYGENVTISTQVDSVQLFDALTGRSLKLGEKDRIFV
ncbi:ABC transporter ATP-binding protein [Fodinisporobacter ferrooxydans]|uniref:ABC transporter ATP-binding protein n=1 Tax=Fodinisporobacter ferrooxydans TaxID=2901836 RepID=A0ABY4CJG9_9BACL|nr:ABC transporter ATP-binding protein [Alicyclobacillaceae bacterium MYW30-H2]